MLSFEALQLRADQRWRERGLQRITAHECRHTCASRLHAAGVRPVIVSKLMGHAAPARQAGAAHITQDRYTHALPGELDQARKAFDDWLASATNEVTAP